MINTYCKIAIALLCLTKFAFATQYTDELSTLALKVYKTPSCGCCNKWISHIQEQGLVVYSKNIDDIDSIKNQYRIPYNHRSCHTAISANGFVFEGHVPAKYIQQFLSEQHPNAIGLTVPAMPVGSPGMEVGERFMPYKVLMLLNDGTSKVYADINSYKEQF
ncbi:DUF411 domain-containing protein [Thalassotalea ganghwensis]